ncbi:ABC transporter permease subunit [Micromonospora sp. NPDC048830]|uniref:ABC transporter permease subunit n=1 Tax=Micromonospora sp. NPDC048830 TaxID=3364257 RepID=UPI003713EB76
MTGPSARLSRVRYGAWAGAAAVTAVGLLAVAGGILAPHDPTAPVGAPWTPPGPDAAWGTDALGRDVLSRVLAGGGHLTLTAAAAAVTASTLGVAGGLVVGWHRGRVSRLLAAGMDLLLAVPLLLIAMVLAVALPGPVAVVAGTVCGGTPLTLRVVADTVTAVRHTGYVEAALGRGESDPVILAREVLPALAGLVRADLAARFVVALQLAAALSLLGLGPAPPAPDWAAMIRENLIGAALNPAALAAPAAALAVVSLLVTVAGQLAGRTRGRPA